MNHPVLDHPALKSCFENLQHLFIELARLKEEPEYEERGGGFGDVRICTLDSETRESKLVAVKTIRLRVNHKEPLRLVFRLARELKVWARLHHPHILPVLGYYFDQSYKTAVLIAEYQIHGDLKDYLEQEDPSWDIRRQLVRDSTDGLAYLHSQDPPIRHGDLKPGNVLIGVERRAMLADFGLSQTLEDGPTGLTTSTGLKGTFRYYSPELLGQGSPPNLSSDIWAWACLAFEVLTKRMPYATKMNDMAVILALATGELPSETEDLPIDDLELKRLLSKCWSPQPNERPSAVYCLGILNSTFLVSHANHGMESTIGQQVLQTEQLRAGGLRRQNALPRGHKLPSTLLSAPVDGNLLSDGGLAANGDGAGFGGSKVAGAAEVLVNPSITPEDVQSFVTSKEYNPSKFDTKPASARYFVIKSYTEDEVFKSLKHEMWTSTEPGNKRLDKAFKENNGHGPIYLFFSVNASGHFCGVAEMLTPVDYTSSIPWAQSKWKGVIKVNWIFVRDIPNSVLRHIRLTNTQERKPVTNSRDTQELPPEAGQEMLRIFLTHPSRTSILQDFAYYENLANNRPMGYQQAGTAPQQDYPMPARQAHSAMGGDFASANKTLTPFIRPQQDARQDTPPMQSTGAMNFGWIASTPTNRIS